MLQLALADTLFLLTLPFKVSEDLQQGWIYPEWMCKAKETILFFNYYASVLFLVVSNESPDRLIKVFFFRLKIFDLCNVCMNAIERHLWAG